MNSQIFSEVSSSNYCYQNNPMKETNSYKNVCFQSKKNPRSEQKYIKFLVKCLPLFWRFKLISANSNYPIKENSFIYSIDIYWEPIMCQAPGIQQCKNPALLEFTFLGRGNTYDMIRYGMIWYMIWHMI